MPIFIDHSLPTNQAELSLYTVVSACAHEIGLLRLRPESQAREALLYLVDVQERLISAVSNLNRDAMTRAACLDPDDE